MLSVVAYKTYKKFAKKYNIKLKNKSIKQLSTEIKNYEYTHNITNGLYY
jgi:hypothetical protein